MSKHSRRRLSGFFARNGMGYGREGKEYRCDCCPITSKIQKHYSKSEHNEHATVVGLMQVEWVMEAMILTSFSIILWHECYSIGIFVHYTINWWGSFDNSNASYMMHLAVRKHTHTHWMHAWHCDSVSHTYAKDWRRICSSGWLRGATPRSQGYCPKFFWVSFPVVLTWKV